MTKILALNHTEARQYFLKEESYFNFDLPSYFAFENLLQAVSAHINNQDISTFYTTYINTGGHTKRHFPSRHNKNIHRREIIWRHINLNTQF